jgi:hypothetical protein
MLSARLAMVIADFLFALSWRIGGVWYGDGCTLDRSGPVVRLCSRLDSAGDCLYARFVVL